jgi:two-component system response regulator
MDEGKLIFIAEDNRNQVLFFEIAIQKAKLPERCFRFFENGLEVKRYFEKASEMNLRTPDLVVVDLRMPIMDGFELIGWLREQGRFKEIPLVVMSSSDEEQDKARARQLGCSYYFVKPPDINELTEMVTGFTGRDLHDRKTVRGVKPLVIGNRVNLRNSVCITFSCGTNRAPA